jgi:hypothetical protein
MGILLSIVYKEHNMPAFTDSMYWGIEGSDGKFYNLHAAKWFVSDNGDLCIYQTQGDGKAIPMISFAAGSWKLIYPASVIDGSPCTFEHFKA